MDQQISLLFDVLSVVFLLAAFAFVILLGTSLCAAWIVFRESRVLRAARRRDRAEVASARRRV